MQVCRFANVLKSLGVKKGDRVAVYLPMIVELPVVLLACARIGTLLPSHTHPLSALRAHSHLCLA